MATLILSRQSSGQITLLPPNFPGSLLPSGDGPKDHVTNISDSFP